jgi:hypothetical protein
VRRESAFAWRLARSAAGIFLFALLFAFVAIVWALLPRDAPIEPLLIVVMGVLAVALLLTVGSVIRARLTRETRGGTSARRHL